MDRMGKIMAKVYRQQRDGRNGAKHRTRARKCKEGNRNLRLKFLEKRRRIPMRLVIWQDKDLDTYIIGGVEYLKDLRQEKYYHFFALHEDILGDMTDSGTMNWLRNNHQWPIGITVDIKMKEGEWR